jgi:hypothetical protein
MCRVSDAAIIVRVPMRCDAHLEIYIGGWTARPFWDVEHLSVGQLRCRVLLPRPAISLICNFLHG